MTVKQQFVFKEDKKHSVIYKPAEDGPANPAIASSVYLSRLVLPRPAPERITIEVDFNPTLPQA